MALAEVVQTETGPMSISSVAQGLEEPWGLAFLPDEAFLVTERGGRLWVARGDAMRTVAGVPPVFEDGQGGLLDVLVPADFATSREVWLTFATAMGDGASTAVGFGLLSTDGARLESFRTVFTGDAYPGGRHFGARLVELPDGTIALTTGDRGTGPDGMQAQDRLSSLGKVILLNRDGSPAIEQEGWLPGAFSRGHRNIQGAALDLSGRLLTVEHGAQGGDELNAPEAGRNYGWPIITYGAEYVIGTKIGEGTHKPGMEQPLHLWVPSIAPSGLAFYQGDRFPRWRGDLFAGALRGQMLVRLRFDGEKQVREERLLQGELGRIRDVRAGPDGYLYLLTDSDDGVIARLEPVAR